MKDELVSICIPAYNAGKYIGRTIISLILQTYKNIEIIITDNDSSDNTSIIIREFETKDKRIRYYKNSSNIGYVGNVREAVRHVRSDYIAIYHADDIYEPGIIEKEKRILESIPGTAGVFTRLREFNKDQPLSFHYPSIYNDLEKSGLFKTEIGCYVGYLNDFLPLIMKSGNFFACPSLMIRKNVFTETGGFTERYPSNEDLDLWLRILNLGYSLAIIDEPLLNYRRTLNQGSSYWDESEDLPVFFKVLDDFLDANPDISKKINLSHYRKNKANGYLTASYNSFIKKNITKALKNKISSIKEYRFSPFTKKGIYQNLTFTAFNIKKIIRDKCLKRRT